MKNLKTTLPILFALFFFLSFAKQAQAQEVSLGVYPPLLEITATAPASIKTPITIQNFSDSPVEVNVLFRSFKSSPKDNGEVEYLPVNEVNGEDKNIFKKIKVVDGSKTLRQITLSPQQKKQLNLAVDLPEDEPPSEYYFSVLFISTALRTQDQNLTAAAGGVATNVLLSVGPKGETTGQISKFSAPHFLTHGPVPFSVKVNNTSDHFISVKGNIVIKNVFGHIIGNIDLLPVNVLSDSDREIPSKESFKNNQTTLIWPEKFLLGIYHADLTIALSEQGPVLHKRISFIAFPTEVAIGLFISLVIVLLAYKRMSQKS